MRKSVMLLISILCFACVLSAQTYQWTNIGLGGGGAQYVPAISPHDPNFMLVACDMSGVYRTVDAGTTWSMIDWHQICSAIDCNPVFHPTDVDKVYAYGMKGTAAANILVSTDRGINWTPLTSTPPWTTNTVYSFYIDRGNASLMFAGTATNAYRSSNGGTTWNTCGTIAGKVVGFLVDQSGPTGAGRICFAATETGGIYRSNDAGATWTQKISGLPSAAIRSFSGGSTASSIYLYCVANSNFDVYKSSDKGDNWVTAMGAGINNTLDHYKVLCADNNPDVLYVNNDTITDDYNIYKSSNNGTNWQNVYNPTLATGNVEHGWLPYDKSLGWGGPLKLGFNINPLNANYLMGSNYGETFLTTDGGTTWKQMFSKYSDSGTPATGKKWTSKGLEVTTVWKYYIDPSDENKHYICYTDIGFARSEDAGKTWYYSATGSPWTNTFYQLAFDTDTPGVIYAAAASHHDLPHSASLTPTHPGGVVKSIDYGKTWTSVSTGLPTTSNCPATSILRDPSDKALYVVCYADGVYKSTNGGTSWTKKSTGLAVGSNNYVYSIKQHSDGSFFCLITGKKPISSNAGGLFKSTNKCESWTNIATKVDGNNPLVYPMEFDVNPSDSKIIYMGSAENNSQGGVYKTTDGGTTWTKGVLPASTVLYNVFGTVIDPMNPQRVYLTTEAHGMFVTNDGGGTWSEFLGVPFKANHWINFDYSKNAMYVGSFGGGVWKRTIPQGVSTTTTALSIKGYPNPCRINNAVNKQFKIVNLPADSVVDIYGVDGDLIRRLLAVDFGNSGWVGWDGRNTNGEIVPQGMYLYNAVTSFGNKTGRVGILK